MIPAHLLAGVQGAPSPVSLGFGSFSAGGGHHSMSPQSLGISSGGEEETHKLRLAVAEMRRDAAVLEQRVRAAEVRGACMPLQSCVALQPPSPAVPRPPLPLPPLPPSHALLQTARRAAEEKFHEKNDQVIGLQNEVLPDYNYNCHSSSSNSSSSSSSSNWHHLIQRRWLLSTRACGQPTAAASKAGAAPANCPSDGATSELCSVCVVIMGAHVAYF